MYTVRTVADLAGVSVRTLHYYDHIGLLKPTSLSVAGYRLYSDQDLERLEQILFLRTLGFTLAEVRSMIECSIIDKRAALEAQRARLGERRQHLDHLLRSIDATIEAMERGIDMDESARTRGFSDRAIAEHQERYRDEARDRWGAEQVDAADRRVARLTVEDRAEIQAEIRSIDEAMASLVGSDPSAPAAQQEAERWFRLINNRFYACTPEMFAGLSDLYVSDSRFRQHYDAIRPGLAAFLSAAMRIYAERLAQD